MHVHVFFFLFVFNVNCGPRPVDVTFIFDSWLVHVHHVHNARKSA